MEFDERLYKAESLERVAVCWLQAVREYELERRSQTPEVLELLHLIFILGFSQGAQFGADTMRKFLDSL